VLQVSIGGMRYLGVFCIHESGGTLVEFCVTSDARAYLGCTHALRRAWMMACSDAIEQCDPIRKLDHNQQFGRKMMPAWKVVVVCRLVGYDPSRHASRHVYPPQRQKHARSRCRVTKE
jgi:hypothetical protein